MTNRLINSKYSRYYLNLSRKNWSKKKVIETLEEVDITEILYFINCGILDILREDELSVIVKPPSNFIEQLLENFFKKYSLDYEFLDQIFNFLIRRVPNSFYEACFKTLITENYPAIYFLILSKTLNILDEIIITLLDDPDINFLEILLNTIKFTQQEKDFNEKHIVESMEKFFYQFDLDKNLFKALKREIFRNIDKRNIEVTNFIIHTQILDMIDYHELVGFFTKDDGENLDFHKKILEMPKLSKYFGSWKVEPYNLTEYFSDHTEKINYKGIEIVRAEARFLEDLEPYLESELILLDRIDEIPNQDDDIKFYEDLSNLAPYSFTVKNGHVDSLVLIDIMDCDFCEIENEYGLSAKFPDFRVREEDVCLKCGIQKIPINLNDLVFLKRLVVWGNLFTMKPIIPESFIKLKNLDTLFLVNTPLKSYNLLLQLESLSKLYLTFGINSIPKPIFKLKSLRHLNLDYNQLYQIPKEIKLMENLEVLSLRDNDYPIEDISDSIGSLTNLRELYLDSNNFKTPIWNTICKLKNLEILSLKNTNIREIPDCICNLKYLKKIYVDKNKVI